MKKNPTFIKSNLLREKFFNQKLKLTSILLIGWAASVCTFAVTVIVGAFFELYFKTSTNRSTILKSLGIEFSSLGLFFEIFALIILIKAFLGFLEKQLIHHQAEEFIKTTQQTLFRNQMFWSHETFSEKSYGKYLLRYSGDLSSIKNMLVNGFHRGLKDVLFLGTGLGLLLIINVNLTLALIAMAILLTPVIIYVDQIQHPVTIEKRNKKSQLLDFVTRSFSKHQEIGTKNKRNRTVRKFNRKLNSVWEATIKYQKFENIRQLFGPILGNILLMVILFTIYQFPQISISPGELLTYLLILGSITGPLRNIVKSPGTIRKGLISLSKIESLIQMKKHKSIMKPTLDGNGSNHKSEEVSIIKIGRNSAL